LKEEAMSMTEMERTTNVRDYAGRLAAAECFAKWGWWPHIVRTKEPEDVRAMLRAYEECAAQHAHPATAALALGRVFGQRLAAYPITDVADALRCVLENWHDAREAAGRTTPIGEAPTEQPPDTAVSAPEDLVGGP
jgi:hypothetical protein